jgi:hypothetical protein
MEDIFVQTENQRAILATVRRARGGEAGARCGGLSAFGRRQQDAFPKGRKFHVRSMIVASD